MTDGTPVPALKEWAAVVHALLDGRQTVLLRKGGIHEKRFALLGSRFVVFRRSRTVMPNPPGKGIGSGA